MLVNCGQRIVDSVSNGKNLFTLILISNITLYGCKSGGTYPQPYKSKPSSASGTELLLQNLNGDYTSLNEINTPLLLIVFWATWCPSCRTELLSLNRLYKDFKPLGLNIVAVGVDDNIQNLYRFKQGNHILFPILFDSKGEMKKKFSINALPAVIVTNPAGKLFEITDPESNQITSRVIGARVWDSTAGRRSIHRLLTDNKP